MQDLKEQENLMLLQKYDSHSSLLSRCLLHNWCDGLGPSISPPRAVFDTLPSVARHMTEFTGLDIEMTFKDHYHEASGSKGWHRKWDRSKQMLQYVVLSYGCIFWRFEVTSIIGSWCQPSWRTPLQQAQSFHQQHVYNRSQHWQPALLCAHIHIILHP